MALTIEDYQVIFEFISQQYPNNYRMAVEGSKNYKLATNKNLLDALKISFPGNRDRDFDGVINVYAATNGSIEKLLQFHEEEMQKKASEGS